MSTIYDLDTKLYYDSGYSTTPSPSSSTSSRMMGSPMSQNNDDLQMLQLAPQVQADFLYQDRPHCIKYAMPKNSPRPQSSAMLVITEQPTDKFRFRYKSEMHGTHGSLLGSNTSKSKKTFPTVELRDFTGKALIRCSLYQVESDKNPMPHSHRLVVRKNDEDYPDPHELTLNPPDNYRAVFQGMGIIHTAKKFISQELFKKREEIMKFQLGRELSEKEKLKLRIECDQQKNMNLNQVVLCFEAYEIHDNYLSRLCDPVFSRPINNMKSALTGELKISRLSACVSSAAGGDDLFLLVEKVGKKNIKVKFFQIDDDDEIIWEAFGDFCEADVHHQYAIALRTPPYKDKDIDSIVEVCIQLLRPSDGDVSEPVPFKYKPRDCVSSRKRARTCSSLGYGSGELPIPLNQFISNDNRVGLTISEEFQKDKVLFSLQNEGSTEFSDFVRKNSEELAEICNPDELFMENMLDECETDGVTKERPRIQKRVQTNESYPKRIYDCLRRMTQTKDGNEITSKTIKKMFLAANSKDEDILHNIIQNHEIGEAMKILKIIDKLKIFDVLQLKNEDGNTCLHIACLFDRSEYIRALINLGTDVNIQNKQGNTALHIAVEENCDMCVTKILESENYTPLSVTLDPNYSNYEGFTPLHIAVRKRNLKLVKKLLESGNSSVKICASKDGNNVLHMAVEQNNDDIVSYLTSRTTVKLNQKNTAGFTPLELARLMGDKARNIITILLSKGAEESLEKMTVTKMEEDEIESASDEDDEKLKIDDFGDFTSEINNVEDLNEKTIIELNSILSKGDTWKIIAKKMNLTSYLCLWKTPLIMLRFIKESKMVKQLINELKEFRNSEALDCIKINMNK